MTSPMSRLVFALLSFVLLGTHAFSQEDQSAIQERMKSRIAQVDQLKVGGLVGENNKGLLEQRAPLSADQTAILNAENTDRRALYNILAGRLGLSAAVVGEQRAANLRERSAAGVWLQGADGNWYKK